MPPIDYLFDSDVAGRQVGRASVVAVHEDGSVSVAGVGADVVRCDVLLPAAGVAPALVPGQRVLVWHAGHPGERGVVLGRIGAARSASALATEGVDRDAVAHPPLTSTLPSERPTGRPDEGEDVPDAIVLEARESLTLRVGDGSITIRADGQILIKGRDLVSSAQRLHRIKGGAVSIN